MAYWLLLGSMVVVATGLLALILTDSQKVRDEKPAFRKAAVAMWLRILMVGWVMFAIVPFAVPGGFDGEWAWIASQPTALRVAMWLLLLPWMLAVWAWQLPTPALIRVAGIVGIAVLTFYLGSRLIDDKPENS